MSIKMTGVNKAAILLLSLEPEVASRVFRALDESEIKDVSQAMATLGRVDPEIIKSVIIEFARDMNTSMSVIGNIHSTERFLRGVLGHDKVNVLLEDIRGPMGRNIWDKIGKMNPMLLVSFLKNEYPQTIALILIKMAPSHAAKILSLFNKETGFEILKRMMSMDTVKKDVIESIEKTLRTEFVTDSGSMQKYDNNHLVAEIFNYFGKQSEEKFMEMLVQYDEDAAGKIKRLMFKFKDILRIDPEGIQELIKVVDKATLTTALKDAPDEIYEIFMQNMSQRAYKLLVEEVEGLRSVRKKDIDDARSNIVKIAKDLINKGVIKMIYAEGDEEEEL